MDDARNMAGLLIYTATPDSDGSLGGLERQGRAPKLNDTIRTIIRYLFTVPR